VKQSSNKTNQSTPDHTSKIDAVDSESFASFVRYQGFESIAGGRRLKFRVKSRGHDPIEVTCDIPDIPFTGTFGVSIQDAAPMAYEKLVEMMATDPNHMLEATTFFLTAEDFVKYVTRHQSHKDRHSSGKPSRQTDIAA
jgi:hypothetical protein